MNAEDLDRLEAHCDAHIENLVMMKAENVKDLIALARKGLSVAEDSSVTERLKVEPAWLCQCGMQSRGQFCWGCGKREP